MAKLNILPNSNGTDNKNRLKFAQNHVKTSQRLVVIYFWIRNYIYMNIVIVFI